MGKKIQAKYLVGRKLILHLAILPGHILYWTPRFMCLFRGVSMSHRSEYVRIRGGMNISISEYPGLNARS